MNKRITCLLFLIILMHLHVNAQEKKIDFFGSGRFALNNGSIGGTLINTDTVTPRKQMRGNTLFDLGFHIKPNEETEIKAITRVDNDINGFWGAGIIMNVRELYLRGLLLKKFRYQVGDLNTKMTPFTLYNYDGELLAHNPIALNTFSEVIAYDKFYGESTWRQQGAQIDFGFNFDRVVNSLNIKSMITKNRHTDYFSTPDRLFSGTSLDFKLFEKLGFQYNLAHVFDVKGSAMFSDARFTNTVHSFRLKQEFKIFKQHLNINGEAGFSDVSYENMMNNTAIPHGNFAHLFLGYKPTNNIQLKIQTNRVETHFRSMGAQSRRVDFNAVASEFAYYTNRESVRPANVLDIITDGTYYNMFLTPNLQGFNPAYENILPYGDATPNRQGFKTDLDFNSKLKGLSSANLGFALYSEITGQGTSNLRNFTQTHLNISSNLNEFYNGKRLLNLSLYYRLQNTQRDGIKNIEQVDLKTNQFKLGLTYEVAPKLFLQAGAIFIDANGNEFMAVRNSFNQISFYEQRTFHTKETLLLGGINYQFSKHNCLKMQWQQVNWDNELLPQNQYVINRFSVLYNLFF